MQVKENKVRDNNYDIELRIMWKSLCRLHSLIIILSFIYTLLGVLHYVVYIVLCLLNSKIIFTKILYKYEDTNCEDSLKR